jgi:hypothetical protein
MRDAWSYNLTREEVGMPISRLLVAGLLLSSWVAAGVAQSVPSRQNQSTFALPSPFLLQPNPGVPKAWLDFRRQVPPFAPKAHEGTTPKQAVSPSKKQTVPPLNLRRFRLFPTAPGHILISPLSPLPDQLTALARNEDLCYTIRNYRFKRDNAMSDATRQSSTSTCQPASQVHLMLNSSATTR